MVMRSVQVINLTVALALLTAVFTPAWGDEAPAPVDAKSSPVDLVNRTPKGNLHNPYKDTEASIVSQGESLFRSYPCSGYTAGEPAAAWRPR
jgi:hypothetical protein